MPLPAEFAKSPAGRRTGLAIWQSHTTVSIFRVNFLRHDHISGGKVISHYESEHKTII
jgi:hypothetical protein